MTRLLLPGALTVILAAAALRWTGDSESHPFEYNFSRCEIDRALVLDAVAIGQDVFAVGEGGCFFSSHDNGYTLNGSQTPVPVLLTALYFSDPKHGWAVGHHATILETVDGGTAWAVRHQKSAGFPLFDVLFTNAHTGCAVGADGAILTTTDGGKLWKERQLTAEPVHLYALEQGSNGMLYAGGEGGLLFQSERCDGEWHQVSSPLKRTIYGLIEDQDALYVYGLRGGLAVYRQGGWELINAAREDFRAGTALRNGTIIIATANKILIEDDEQNFRSLPSELNKLTTLVEAPNGDLLIFNYQGLQRLGPRQLKEAL